MVFESCGANRKKHNWKVTIFIEELQEQFVNLKEKEKNKHLPFYFSRNQIRNFTSTVALFYSTVCGAAVI